MLPEFLVPQWLKSLVYVDYKRKIMKPFRETNI